MTPLGNRPERSSPTARPERERGGRSKDEVVQQRATLAPGPSREDSKLHLWRHGPRRDLAPLWRPLVGRGVRL